jgi:hypothetical protein
MEAKGRRYSSYSFMTSALSLQFYETDLMELVSPADDPPKFT